MSTPSIQELRRALERDQFVLHYQPKVELATGVATEVEALLRWQHTRLGLLSPDEFLDLAREEGLIPAIGGWVRRTGVEQLGRWVAQGLDLSLCTNVAAEELHLSLLLGDLDDVVAHTPVHPDRVILEMTESVRVTDLTSTMTQVLGLQSHGFRVYLDDFGTGYSSLSWLQALPVDALKLDRSFVARLGHPRTDAIVQAVLALSRAMGVKTVGEGVETRRQLDELAHLGCDDLQGFYFSRPVSAEELPAALTTAEAALAEALG